MVDTSLGVFSFQWKAKMLSKVSVNKVVKCPLKPELGLSVVTSATYL